MATDDVIQQRLGKAPEDEAVKERLEREHGALLEELRALIPRRPGPVRLPARHPLHQPVSPT
jgi:hypothetical protein